MATSAQAINLTSELASQEQPTNTRHTFSDTYRALYIIFAALIFIAPIILLIVHGNSYFLFLTALPWLTGISIHLIATGLLSEHSLFSRH